MCVLAHNADKMRDLSQEEQDNVLLKCQQPLECFSYRHPADFVLVLKLLI